MKLPTITAKNNYAMVVLGQLTLWFSYSTLVAFQTHNDRLVVRKNEWGPTTGKHLNAIDGGNMKARVDSDEFETLWRIYSIAHLEKD